MRHYDSRLRAEQGSDPTSQHAGARALTTALWGKRGFFRAGVRFAFLPGCSKAESHQDRSLVFFDAEITALAGWDWILGSQAFVENLLKAGELPDACGDHRYDWRREFEYIQEKNSDPGLTEQIGIAPENWAIRSNLSPNPSTPS